MPKWIFNRKGHASALDCDDAVYDKGGSFRLWIVGNNLYDRSGNHVGWVDKGVFYDRENGVIGFTDDHTAALPSIPGIGAIPAMPGIGARPARPAFGGIPGRRGFGRWSDTLLEDYISEQQTYYYLKNFMRMSGGGGGGGDIPPIRPRVTVSCERLVIETTLVKPNEEM